MKKNYIVIIVLGIFCLLLFGLVADAATGIITKQVSVTYRNIRVFADGGEVSGGEAPFVLTGKGVTMVPIRLVAEALGKNVTWDAKNNIIQIGTSSANPGSTAPGRVVSGQFTWLEKMMVIRNVGPFYQQQGKNFMILAGAHKNGIACLVSEGQTAEVVVKLDQAYKGLDGWLGIEDETMNTSGSFVLRIFADDRLVYKSPTILPASYPVFVEAEAVPGIEGAHTLKFQVQWLPTSLPGDYKDVIATLADFRLYK